MKVFHIGDVLSVTTGRLVSSRHMDGVYDILNFLTTDDLFTHQLPRACEECKPWLRTQFPRLFPDNPLMTGLLSGLDANLKDIPKTEIPAAVARWVEAARIAVGLPEMLPVYEMGADMHVQIDPIEELESMVGKDRLIVVQTEGAGE